MGFFSACGDGFHLQMNTEVIKIQKYITFGIHINIKASVKHVYTIFLKFIHFFQIF